jgi:hypothetical protein
MIGLTPWRAGLAAASGAAAGLMVLHGSLESAAMERWGNLTPDGHCAAIPFGVSILAERTFGGYTVPSGVRVGWWYGTDRAFEFFRAEVVQATFLPSEQNGVSDDDDRDAVPTGRSQGPGDT